MFIISKIMILHRFFLYKQERDIYSKKNYLKEK